MVHTSDGNATTEDLTVAEYADRLSQEYRRTPEESLEGPKKALVERRSHERREFPKQALVAPWEPSVPPRKLDYRPCQCRNLSEAGIAFWCRSQPTTKRLGIQLQISGKTVQLKAQVMHVTPECEGEEEGFLVGCRLEGRVE